MLQFLSERSRAHQVGYVSFETYGSIMRQFPSLQLMYSELDFGFCERQSGKKQQNFIKSVSFQFHKSTMGSRRSSRLSKKSFRVT